MQDDQVAALTGENLALKRETEALLARQKKIRWGPNTIVHVYSAVHMHVIVRIF